MMGRVLVFVAGLVGAAGVAAAAASSHVVESRNLAAISAICLSHGPALLALGLYGQRRPLLLSACLLAVGTAVFAGDLGIREWLGQGLFPGAAPLGGGTMMAGWIALSVAALIPAGQKT